MIHFSTPSGEVLEDGRGRTNHRRGANQCFEEQQVNAVPLSGLADDPRAGRVPNEKRIL
jgi:hypothetical protein